MFSKSVQIIRSVEEKNANINQEHHVIRLIEQYEDGPCLRDILCRENKNLPIFVISIYGKTRTGKSFLLNLMIKYLESKGAKTWKNGNLPSVFEWKSGSKSITKGLWICSKVFKMLNICGKEVGVLLLDNQGLYDGEQTDGVSVAISGISTALSFYQMFNLKDNICENDLESIWRHLVSEKTNASEESSDTKLLFLVRDSVVEEEFGYGLDGGQAYIESEKNRGTSAHKDMWKELGSTFRDIGCVLLPLPGMKVMKGSVKEMSDIDPEFLEEVEVFFNAIFGPENLTKKVSTGQNIFDTLKTFDGKTADESLSFINVFTEQGNESKLDALIKDFDSRLGYFIETSNRSKGQQLLDEYLTNAKKRFKGKSACDFLVKLEEVMVQKFNLSLKKWILGKYEMSLKRSSSFEFTHSPEWALVRNRTSYFVGSEIEKKNQKQIVYMKCAEIYYNNLREELKSKFRPCCQNKTLQELQGYDERFVSRKFKENQDFRQIPVKDVCYAIWIKEKESLRIYVQDILLTYVAELTGADKEWLQNSTKAQFKFYELFTWNGSHWIELSKHDDTLQEVVAFAIYKKVQELTTYSKEERKQILNISKKIKSCSECEAVTKKFYKKVQELTTYSKEERKQILNISKEIKSCSECEAVTMTCIFILYKYENKESCEPVFKVKRNSSCKFIDIKGRVYENWEAFEGDNKLPDCLYCHPAKGEYNKEEGFQVAFTFSPASSLGHKILKVVDVVGKGVGVVSAGALATVVAFPITPVVVGGAVGAGASGAYGLVRGINKINDKVDHKEGVEVEDVTELVNNTVSVVTAGVATGAAILTRLGRELSHAPAIIRGINWVRPDTRQLKPDNRRDTSQGNNSLTNLIDTGNFSYLSVANDISMFLLFNNKSIGGAIEQIKTSYNLPPVTSNVDTLKYFIDKNSVVFPTNDGETLRTEQFFSDNLKTFLLTGLMNNPKDGPLQFLRQIAYSENLESLTNVFSDVSPKDEQVQFFGDVMSLAGRIIESKRNENYKVVSYRALGYHPSSVVTKEVVLACICTGLSSIDECSYDENVQQVCCVTKEILKLVCKTAEKTDLKAVATYLEKN